MRSGGQTRIISPFSSRGCARRIACAEAALQDRQDGIDDCVAQRTAEFSVCTQLGGVRYHPPIKPANFVAGVTNPFFPLVTGRTLVYEGTGPDGLEHDEVTPTGNTRVILGVTCTEVRDVVTLDGALVEDTLDWYAQDAAGNVWYFGEESKSYEAGRLVSLEGSWVAGRDGALPGIIMEAAPAVGDIYRQEFLAMEAEDVARVVATGRMVTVPAGTYQNCMKIKEVLSDGAIEYKYFAKGVGCVREVPEGGDVTLKSHTTN